MTLYFEILTNRQNVVYLQKKTVSGLIGGSDFYVLYKLTH